MSVKINIDRRSPTPLHRQIAQCIEEAIRDGRLPRGQRLEHEVALASRLQVSRPTVRQAMDSLVRQGLLVRKRGVGTQVVGDPIRRSVQLTSLHEDLGGAGHSPTTAVTSFSWVRPQAEIAEALQLGPEDTVCHFTRIRSVNGLPLALMENWVRGPMETLTADSLVTNGLYEILRHAGANLRVGRQSMGATAADGEQAVLLHIGLGDPLVTMQRTVLDNTGEAIETGRHFYRADSYTFDITLVEP